MATAVHEPTSNEAAEPANGMPPVTWAPLVGIWKFNGGIATYEGPGEHTSGSSYGIARSNIRFRDGVVSTKITLTQNSKTSGGLLFGFQSPERPYVGVALGAFDRAYSIFELRSGGAWVAIAQAGSLENLRPSHTYDFEVRVEGQKVRLTVEGVDVLDAVLQKPLSGTGLCLYAYDSAKVRFEGLHVQKDRPRIFVVMPFKEPYDTLYREVIQPVAQDEMHFKVVRVDEVHGPGVILDDIRQQIEEAHVIVAEVTEANPNVFYELGYAHALRKPAVLLVRRDRTEFLPFDIRGYRAIFYDDTIGGKKTVEDTLRKHLDALRRDD